MSNHDELVKRLRAGMPGGQTIEEAADAIELLTAERDGFVEQLAAREKTALERDMQVIMRINNDLLAQLAASRAREGRMREALTVCATEFHSVVSFKGLELVADEFCRRITLAAKALTAAPADAQGASEGETARHHKRVVGAREMYEQPDCPDEMIWDICMYLRGSTKDFDCLACPRWEDDPDHGKYQRGCFGLAHEACRIAIAWQKRIAGAPSPSAIRNAALEALKPFAEKAKWPLYDIRGGPNDVAIHCVPIKVGNPPKVMASFGLCADDFHNAKRIFEAIRSLSTSPPEGE